MKTLQLTPYRAGADNRGICLSRIEAWRKAPQKLHSYGTDGRESRRPVRVLVPDYRQDLLGGAFREVRTVEEIQTARERLAHRGWYTDPDGCTSKDGTGLCWGVVAYLGHSRWLAGYVLGGTDCGGYHLDSFYDSEKEAAHAADEIARIVAEKECEYQQRFNEAQALESEIEDAQQRLAECLALRNDKRSCFAGLRDEAHELLGVIRDKRDTLRTDFAGVL